MLRVKFCGLTNLEDAQAAIELGANLLGFNFYANSPRCLTVEACAAIVAGLGDDLIRPQERVRTVGIFVNHRLDEVVQIMSECRLDLAQLSGDEPPDDLREIGPAAYKAIRLGRDTPLDEAIQPYLLHPGPPVLLIDASVPGAYGGTGQVADWERARLAAAYFPILLAGGLQAGNIAQAVRQVRPWGVDVASGIEASPGRKDRRKMAAFMQAVREVEAAESIIPGHE